MLLMAALSPYNNAPNLKPQLCLLPEQCWLWWLVAMLNAGGVSMAAQA